MSVTMPGSVLVVEDDHAKVVTLSPYVRTTLWESDGIWAAHVDLIDKREPTVGTPYDERDLRLIMCDITAAYEHVHILNDGKITNTLDDLRRVIQGGNN